MKTKKGDLDYNWKVIECDKCVGIHRDDIECDPRYLEPKVTKEPSTMSIIWANRFLNIGQKKPKLCNDVQAKLMQRVIDEAYKNGRRDEANGRV